MDNKFQVYMFALIEEMKNSKLRDNPEYLSRYSYLLEYKTLIMKTPRQVGKSYLINALACTEKYPIIYSKYNKNFTPILHDKVVMVGREKRGYTIPKGKINAVFFDEIADKWFIEDTLAKLNTFNKIEYAVALYT